MSEIFVPKYLLKSKSEVISLSENMATKTDSLVNKKVWYQKINAVMATQWRKSKSEVAQCILDAVLYSMP